MKNIFALLIAALVMLPALGHSQTASTTQTLLVTNTSAVAANTTATVTSQAFRANSATGFSVTPSFVLSGTGVANVTFAFQVSLDGTTWSTTTPLTYAVAATGVTAVIGYANFPVQASSSAAANAPWYRLASVTNANTPSTLTINSITICRSNR